MKLKIADDGTLETRRLFCAIARDMAAKAVKDPLATPADRRAARKHATYLSQRLRRIEELLTRRQKKSA